MKQRLFWIGLAVAVFAGAAAAWAEDVPPPNAPPPAAPSMTDMIIDVLKGTIGVAQDAIDALQLTKDLGAFLVVVQAEGTKIAADQLRCTVDEQNCKIEKTKRCIAHSKSFANIEAQFKVMHTRAQGARIPADLRPTIDVLLTQIEVAIQDAKVKLTKDLCETE